ncbi:MAG: hypothetical protein GY845_03245 [Planctomycetes bacterium]|nr:hypothetical protein [Planctomycetota bacterium]
MEDNWFEQVSQRCPWMTQSIERYCSAMPHDGFFRPPCTENNCAPLFMAATIISAYKDDEKKSSK